MARLRIATIVGTRPEIIRLSRIIPRLDAVAEHRLIHTGQNFDPSLKDVFFRELEVRDPDEAFEATGSFGEQAGKILEGTEKAFARWRPDRVLILGDTNSGLAAVVAKRSGIPVYHMEAGNRCYDDRVPEEVNRRIIDHSSDVLLPYTENSRQNLLREGIAGDRVYVTGNPIWEVIRHYGPRIEASNVLERLGLRPGGYFLATLHRAENVDLRERLEAFTRAFARLQQDYGLPIIISTHPRTRSRMGQFGLGEEDPNLRFLEPFGFFDFISLEKRARCVLSDSGTVQEECALLQVPNVTLRDVTERPETLECGSNVLSGADVERICHCVALALNPDRRWEAPREYLRDNVADTVVRILTGHRRFAHGTA